MGEAVHLEQRRDVPGGMVGVGHRRTQELECCNACAGGPQLGFVLGSTLVTLWEKLLAEYLGMQT